MNTKAAFLLGTVLLVGCASTPSEVSFNGKTVGTYGASAGCGTLNLDEDCSQMSGSTREIVVNGIPLRVSGGAQGTVVFLMSMPKLMPDEAALSTGASAVESHWQEEGVTVLSTKVMYGSGKVFGVHYTLDKDGYSSLKELAASGDNL